MRDTLFQREVLSRPEKAGTTQRRSKVNRERLVRKLQTRC